MPESSEEIAWYQWYSLKANHELAGIYGAQRRWSLAMRYELWSTRLSIEQNFLPYVGAAFCLMALWVLLRRRSDAARIPNHVWGYLCLFAITPLLFVLGAESAKLFASAVLYGNPFIYLALESLHPHVSAVFTTIWVFLFIACSVGIQRSRCWRESSQFEQTTRIGIVSERPIISGRKGKKLALYITVAALGWALAHATNERWFVDAALHIPANLAWWHHSGRADAFWVFDTAFDVTVGSWVQELFFRGVVYLYARRYLGVGFALVFSSFIFATWHGQPTNFEHFFWTGVALAVQYEVSGSLIPSTTTHCLHNFLAFIGARP